MKVSYGYANRVVKCGAECGKGIEAGDKVVVQTEWNKNGWHRKVFKHLKCWLVEIEVWFEKNPYQATKPVAVKSKLELTEEQRKKRNKILRKHSVLVGRIRGALENINPEADETEKLGMIIKQTKFQLKEQSMAKELRELGGVPESWGVGNA